MASPEDLSSLRSPLSLGVSGLTQLLEGYHAGTEEIRRILTHDCDVIMECRTCRSLYRGLPNFLAHRRCYCNKPTVPEPTDQVSPPTGKRVRRNNKARIDLRPKMRSDITAGSCPDSSKQEFPEIVEPPPPAEPPELELEPKKSVEPLRLPEPPRSSRSSSRRQATLESGRTSTFSLEDYTCPHCPYSHPVVRNVVQHVISRHHYDKDKAEYYKLKLKELGDRRRESLLQNLSSNRTTRSTTEAPQGTMLCPLCPKTCVRVRDVINHLISKHKLDSEKANSYKNDIVSIDDDKEVDQERRRKKSVPEKCETSADGEKDVSETDTKSVPSTSETMSPTHMECPPSAAQDEDPIDSPTKSQEASVFASNDISAKNISVGSGFSLWQCTLCTKLCGNESAMMAHINLCKGDSSSESESRHDKESAELDSVDTSLSETVKDKVAQSNVSGEDVVKDTFDEPLPEDVHNQVADEASDLMEMVADECTISKDTDELLVSEKDIVEVVKEKHSEGNESGGKHNVDEPMPKDVESESAKLKEVDEASEMNIDECTISKDTDELLDLEEDIVEVVKEKHSKEKESGEVPGKHNVDEPMPKDVDNVDEALEMNTDECGISNDTDELLEKEIVDTCDTKQVKDVEISELDTSVVDRANTPRSKSECADSTDSNRASENDIDQSSPSDINDGAEQESNESFQRYNIVSKDVSPKVTENDLPSSPSGEEDDSPQGKNNDGKNLDKDEVSVPKDVGSGCAVSHESDGGSERDTVDEPFPENMEGEEIIDQLESSPLQICGNECTSESALIEVQPSEALERKAEEIIEHENAMQEDVSIEAGVGATLIFDEGGDVKGNELDEASEKDDVDMLNKLFTTVSKEEKLVVELSRDHNSNHEMKLLQASVSEQLLVKHSESSHERKRKLSDSESEESVKRCCLEKVEMPSTQTLVKTENQDSSSDDNQTTWSWFDDDGSLSAPMDDVHSTKKTAVKREEKAPVESNRALTCPECSYKSCRMYEIERHLRTEHKHFSQRDIMAYKRRFRPSRWRSQLSPKRKPFTRRMITLRKIGSDQSSSSVNHETFADTQLSKDVDEEQLALNSDASDEVDEATMESVETHSNLELINESQVEVELPSPAPVLAKPEPQEDSRSAQSAIIYPSMPVLEKQEPLTNTQINADSPMPSDPVQTDHQTNEATLDLEISDDAKQESHKTITDANRSQDPCYEEARDTEEMIIVDGRKSPEPDNDMDNFDDSECTPEKPFYDTSDEGSTSPTILPDSATLAYFAYRASGHPYRSRRRGVVGVHSLYRGADQEPRVDPGRRQGGPGKMDPPQSSYTALACVECAVQLYDLLSMVRHLQNQHCWNMVKISRSLARITESVTLRGDQIIQESIHTTAAQCSKSAKSGKHKKVIPRAKSKKGTQNRAKTTAAHRLRTEHDLAAKSCTASTKSDTQSGRKEKRSRCAKLSHKISSCKPKGKDYTTTTHNKDASETIVEHSTSMDGSPVKIVSSKSGKKFYYKLTTKCAKAQYNNISKSTSKNKSKASVKTSKKTSKATSERTARNSSVPSRFTRRTMADKRTDLS